MLSVVSSVTESRALALPPPHERRPRIDLDPRGVASVEVCGGRHHITGGCTRTDAWEHRTQHQEESRKRAGEYVRLPDSSSQNLRSQVWVNSADDIPRALCRKPCSDPHHAVWQLPQALSPVRTWYPRL